MSEAEKNTLVMNIVGGMDTYVREVIDDDMLTERWNICGVPDNANEEDLRWYAESPADFSYLCTLFSKLVKADVEVE